MFKLVVLSVALAVAAANPNGLLGVGLATPLAASWATPLAAGIAAPLAVPAILGASNYRGPLSLAPGQPANILAADGRPLDTLSVNIDKAIHQTAKVLEGGHWLKKRSIIATSLAGAPLVASPLAAGSLVASPLAAGSLVASPLAAGPLVASPLAAASLATPWAAGIAAPLAAPIATPLAAPIAAVAAPIATSNYRGPLSLAPGQPANILAADGRPLDTLSVNLDRAVHATAKAIEGSGHWLKKRSIVAAPLAAAPLAAAPIAWGSSVGLVAPAPIALAAAAPIAPLGLGIGARVGHLW